ncbi:hypothetical protein W04_2822 [Pseudoalteromonas sp. SW0106-04]|nr:hypothetical protein W04_2822 [Pseudoalteromonas sp. SW0106-04]
MRSSASALLCMSTTLKTQIVARPPTLSVDDSRKFLHI